MIADELFVVACIVAGARFWAMSRAYICADESCRCHRRLPLARIVPMSERRGILRRMEIDHGKRNEANAWARLQGLISMLALPPLRRPDGTFHRQLIEIMVGGDEWRVVETMIVTEDEVIFKWGANGTAIEMRFKTQACPAWRMVR